MSEASFSKFELVRLLQDDGTWLDFESDWRQQCDEVGEDFDNYAEATLGAVRDIIEKEAKKAGVFALTMNGIHVAMCQVNSAMLPGYDGPVARVRFITLSPTLDYAEGDISQYAEVMIKLLMHVIKLALNHDEMRSKYVKFHLRSPADTQFFQAVGKGLNDTELFGSVAMRGSWLYIAFK
ncbi:hypothetical protein [Rhizobium sp. RU36D]|uniref:hypothetical protein n=1 Tax=Rhizobium sp. RU36D TaxID=1907415 RepID=UPI0009D8AA88|nr:hypothetical protein [Rhizobium sp. RU36D]SMD13955.1 hypothetical protein SAMN05880593_12564 [Rhizobium sp. RU36D]